MKGSLGITGAVCLALILAGSTQASEAEDADLRAEVAALRAEVAELRRGQEQHWLDERRAEEVKALVREVLTDAEARASLTEGGLRAGWDKGFFLAGGDEQFLMKISGQLQFRYLHNFQQSRSDEDGSFQVRRARLTLAGHVGDPRFGYELAVGAARGSGDLALEDLIIRYRLNPALELQGGVYKLPFLREELLSSKRMLAVERASVTEFFTLDRSEQVALHYQGDRMRGAVSFNDGASEEFSDLGADAVEVAATGRAEFRLRGDWKQADELIAWRNEGPAFFAGAAAHYQLGDGHNADNGSESEADYVAWTVDVLAKCHGLSLMAAGMGGHVLWDDGLADNRHMYGALAQAGYNLNDRVQPFVRYEWLDASDGGEHPQIATAGFNYFLDKHNAKFTTDAVWVFDGDIPAANPFGAGAFSSGLGLSGFAGGADDDPLFAVRTQFQLLF